MIYDFGVEDELAEMVSAISQRNRLNLTGTSAKEEELSFDLSLIKFKSSKSMSRWKDSPKMTETAKRIESHRDEDSILNTSRQSTRLRERGHMYSTSMRLMKKDAPDDDKPGSPSVSSQAFNKLKKKLAPNLGYAFMDETAAELCIPLSCESQELPDEKDQSMMPAQQSVTESAADESFLPELNPMPVFTSTQESDVPSTTGGAETASNIASGYNLSKFGIVKPCSVKLIDVIGEKLGESIESEYCDAMDESFVSMVNVEVQTSPIEVNSQMEGIGTGRRSEGNQSPPLRVLYNTESQLPDLIPCCSYGSVKKCWSDRMLRSAEKCDRRSARIKRTEDEDKEGQTTPHSRKDETPGRRIEIMASPHVTKRLSASASLDERKRAVGLRRSNGLLASDASNWCSKKRKSIHIVPDDFNDRLNSLKADVRACFLDETKISQQPPSNGSFLQEQTSCNSRGHNSPRRSYRRKPLSNKGNMSNNLELGGSECISQSFRPAYTSTQNPNSVNVITIKRFSPQKARMVKQSIVVRGNDQSNQAIGDETDESEEEVEMVSIGCQTSKIDSKNKSTAVDPDIFEYPRSQNCQSVQACTSRSTGEQDMNVTEQLCVSLKKRIDQHQNVSSNNRDYDVDGFKQSKNAASPFKCKKKLTFAFKKHPSMSTQISPSKRSEVTSSSSSNFEKTVGYSKETINSMSDAEFYQKFCLKYLSDVYLEKN
ncbi:uncharacterized protein LOC142336511 isoform X3 [Convolutriloba macropyga]|uniref:uncharacterized protein LOC142336511 isoform X3 n=1 Tax=Convolutriloba macropyga TaxID=536237 RepID=UPI003F51FD3D